MIKRGNCVFRALNRASQRMPGKVCGVEEFAHQFVGSVFNHFHFLENYLLLSFQIILVKPRMREEVGDQVKRRGETLVRNLYGETSHLMGCKRIKIAPQPI